MSLDDKSGGNKLWAFEIDNITKAIRNSLKLNIGQLSGQVDNESVHTDRFTDTTQQNNVKDYIDSDALSGQKDVVVSNGSQFSVGENIIIYDGEGTFETAEISNIVSNTLTMTVNLTNNYNEGSYIGKYLGYLDTTNNKYQRLLAPDLGDGSDGAFTSSGNVTWSTDKNYTSITIQSGHTITISGNIDIKCQGTIDIQSGGKISAKDKGYGGGIGGQYYGTQGDSELGAGTIQVRTANGSGGGAATCDGSSSSVAGGGGGGYGVAGADAPAGYSCSGGGAGYGGLTKNDASLGNTFTIEYMKGGGGGGGKCVDGATYAGDGGAGGGVIKLHCKKFICSGEIDCDGNDGQNATTPPTNSAGGGGGGAGGTIYIQTIQLITAGNSLIHANGGAAGAGAGANARAGGAGGNGRIRIEAGKITGTTSPTYTNGYNNNRGAFGKYGFYHSEEIKTLNEIITANAYIKQNVVRTANISGATSSAQKDVIVDDASVFNAGDKVILYESEKMEIAEISSISSNTLTMVDNLNYSYTTSGDVLGIDSYAYCSIEPTGDTENQVAMILQTAENLGSNIWYFTWSKTIKIDNTPANGEAGVRLVGRVRLQGKDNDTTDINVTEINWSFY